METGSNSPTPVSLKANVQWEEIGIATKVFEVLFYTLYVLNTIQNILLYDEAVTVDNAFYRCKIVFYTKTKYNTKKT